MFFLDNVMFAMWYLPFSFFHHLCPGTPESKNTTFSAAKAVKSLCMFLPPIHTFFAFLVFELLDILFKLQASVVISFS